jgi:hypothetical protein
MNVPAACIAAGLGAAFFAAELTFYFQPDWINLNYVTGLIVSPQHTKARAAVARLLINPDSAEFGSLRSVEVEKAKYVCGAVKAKDRAGYYAAYREFVYTVALDQARIDDDGWIAQKHGAFRRCPAVPEEKLKSPDAVTMAQVIEKAVPSSAMSAIGSRMSSGGGGGSGGSLEQQVGHMADKMTGGPMSASPSGSGGFPGSGSAGISGSGASSGSADAPTANSIFMATLGNEREWRGDRPPAAWPAFPSGHPLAKSAQKRSTGLAFALAKDVEERWEQTRSGNAKERPSPDEIQDACRALLTIDPKDNEFPKAWATFVRLRKIEREASS